ncbi:MAG: TonB-dependent receptor, partial [Steroidobacteraceae bacterium]|nr:TonB-dependent receptor [Steroidobacteraceae bacterium]MDW8259522.1 TonB-dependent receptor [Gammaproteobacteria bacterium]
VTLAITVISADAIRERVSQDARDLVNFSASITFYSDAIDDVIRTPRPERFEASARARVSDHAGASNASKTIFGRFAVPIVADRFWLAVNGVYSDIGGRRAPALDDRSVLFDEDNPSSQWVRANPANPATPATAPIMSINEIIFRQSRGLEWFENRALFGELAYDLTGRLTLTAEGRYQRQVLGYDACTTCGTVNPVDRRFFEQDFLPRFTVEYEWTDDVLSYAYWSRGTKGGRVNTSAAAFNCAYRVPEELDNIELGVKSRLLDGRAIFNAAIYRQDIEGMSATWCGLTDAPKSPSATGVGVRRSLCVTSRMRKRRSVPG